MVTFIILAFLVLVIAYFVTRPGGIRGTIMAYRVGYHVSQKLWSEIESRSADVTNLDVRIGIGNAWFLIDPGSDEHRVIVELVAGNICKGFRQDNLVGDVTMTNDQTEFRFRNKHPMCLEGGA